MKLTEILDKADEEKTKQRRVEEADKAGILRAGNSGAILPDGSVIGKCHRAALARFLGLEPQLYPDNNKKGYFALGLAHELWVESVVGTMMDKKTQVMLCEEYIPTKWTTKDGTLVTGRPDMVICNKVSTEPTSGYYVTLAATAAANPDEYAVPEIGIELKALGAANAAAGVWYQGPKTDHLLQSLHYMLELNLDSYQLFYSYMGSAIMPWWVKSQFPATYEKILQPFRKEFTLTINKEGFLCYAEVNNRPTATVIKPQMLRDYYQLLTEMKDRKTLYRRHSDKDHTGSSLAFSVCNYCQYKDACNSSELDYDAWCDVLARDKLANEV